MRIQYRPLPAVWPFGTPTDPRKESRFRAGYSATLELLRRELRELEAGDVVVIEGGYRESDIRIDGYPRATARPSDPSVIISFDSRYGRLRYGCDRFWEHDANLRAIALTLEALRAADRYGATKRGEQYAGWQALPEMAGLTTHEAVAFIRSHAAGGPDQDLHAAYKAAAKKLNPAAPGASREAWDQLRRAREALGL